MSDYIKREDAKKYLYNFASKEFHKRDMVFAGRLTAIQIKDVPSADVAPVRHGRWVEMSYDEYKCSACEKVVREEILYAIKPSDREDASMHIANYCPNCGARMDGENDEID